MQSSGYRWEQSQGARGYAFTAMGNGDCPKAESTQSGKDEPRNATSSSLRLKRGIALPDIITMRKRPRNTEAECVGLYTPANALGAINHPEENAVDHAMKRAAKLLSTTDPTPGFVDPQRSMTGDGGAPHELKGRLDSALSCLSWQISSFTEKITQMLCPEVELSSSWLVNIRAASAEFKEMYERLSAAYYQCFLQVQRESRDEVRQQMIAEITAMAIQ